MEAVIYLAVPHCRTNLCALRIRVVNSGAHAPLTQGLYLPHRRATKPEPVHVNLASSS